METLFFLILVFAPIIMTAEIGLIPSIIIIDGLQNKDWRFAIKASAFLGISALISLCFYVAVYINDACHVLK